MVDFENSNSSCSIDDGGRSWAVAEGAMVLTCSIFFCFLFNPESNLSDF